MSPFFQTALRILTMVAASNLSGCISTGALTHPSKNVEIPNGPPVEEIVTIFDKALICLRDEIPVDVTFAVGDVTDATGRETYADGASGRFVSQGAGEMVQSALFKAGATVINRRDAKISIMETQWGIRNLRNQTPVNFFMSGTINSLDFIPGGGASIEVSGVGPRYRQNRILVGLDLALTDSFSGRVLASIPLQKQIYSMEVGATVGRFFGDTLVSFEVGAQQREAVHFVLRQMLNLAAFELLGQIVDDGTYRKCRTTIEPYVGENEVRGTSRKVIRAAVVEAKRILEESRAAVQSTADQNSQQGHSQQASQDQVAAAKILKLADQASLLAAKSIAMSEEARTEADPDAKTKKAAQALALVQQAGKLLRAAANAGLAGARGDAVAIVVQRALELAIEVNELKPPKIANDSLEPAPARDQPNLMSPPDEAINRAWQHQDRATIPGTPEYERAQKVN